MLFNLELVSGRYTLLQNSSHLYICKNPVARIVNHHRFPQPLTI